MALSPGRPRVRSHELLGEHGIEIEGQFLDLGNPERAHFAKALCDLGLHGSLPIPMEPEHCRQALGRYQAYREQMHAEFAERAGQKMTDAKLQARVVKLVEGRVYKS